MGQFVTIDDDEMVVSKYFGTRCVDLQTEVDKLKADLTAERKKNDGYEIIVDHATKFTARDTAERVWLERTLAATRASASEEVASLQSTIKELLQDDHCLRSEISRLTAEAKQRSDAGLLESYRQQMVTLEQQRDTLAAQLKDEQASANDCSLRLVERIKELVRQGNEYRKWANTFAMLIPQSTSVAQEYHAFVANQSQPAQAFGPPDYDWAEALAVEIERILSKWNEYWCVSRISLVLQQYRCEHPHVEPLTDTKKPIVTC